MDCILYPVFAQVNPEKGGVSGEKRVKKTQNHHFTRLFSPCFFSVFLKMFVFWGC